VTGLLEDELVGGEGVGSASFAGDGDGAGDRADVLSADLGDLVDAHAGVGGEDDLGAGVPSERECEDGVELGVGDWSGVAGWGLGSGDAGGGVVGSVVGLEEPLTPGPQDREVGVLSGCAGEGGEPGADGLRGECLRGLDNVREHGFAADGVQHFGLAGIHARAFACGEDDDV